MIRKQHRLSLLFAALALLALQPLATAEQTTDAPPANPAFDILEFRVLGNSVLPPTVIETAVYPSTGPNKTMSDVQSARDALERAYRDAGYGTVFVDVPEQDVAEGVVRLKITEGRLDRVRVSGARYFSNGRILAALPTLQRGTVPSLTSLQAELSAVNRSGADRSVTPILKAGRTPGTVDVDLKVSDALPVHGSVTYNNRYTANTTQTRANFELGYANLFQRFHSLTFQFQTAPQATSQARVFAATYLAPLENGNLLAVYGVDTHSDVAAIGALAVRGTGRIYGARYIHPWSSSGGAYSNVSFGADLKDFSETIDLTDGNTDKTPIKYLNWSAVYSRTLRQDRSLSNFTIGANFGLRRIINRSDQFAFKRFDGRANYFYLRGTADIERPSLLGTLVVAKANIQLAAQPLISNEQIGIGGLGTVRGYLESNVLGDFGWSGSLEIHAPAWNSSWRDSESRFDGYAFYDAGAVGIVEPLGQARRTDLASLGVGFHYTGFKHFSASLDWAYPLVPSADVAARDGRLHFEFRYEF